MVGSGGNAPVRRFRLCFLTPDLQSGSRITSPGGPAQAVGSGSGSHTHLKKFMRLLSVLWSSFPRLKLACRAEAAHCGSIKPRLRSPNCGAAAFARRIAVAKAGGVGG